MSIEQPPVALPKLYGAPAYARPPAPIDHTGRPFDPDQLPIQAAQTDQERRMIARLPARAYGVRSSATGLRDDDPTGQTGGLRPRLFRLLSMAGQLLGGR